MPWIGTWAGSTHKSQEGFLEFPPCTFPSTVCLALGCNTTVSLLITVHASESFRTTSCGGKLTSSILGSVSSSKFLKLLFLVSLLHPGSTPPSRGGFWGIETWVIRPRPSLRLHSSKRTSCCDYARGSKFGCRHTLKENLRKSNLAFRGVKKFNSIIPSADVGNFQTKNEWLMMTPTIWIETCCSPTISGLSHYSKGFKRGISKWCFRYPRLQKTTAGSRIYNEDSFRTLYINYHCRGAIIWGQRGCNKFTDSCCG